MEVRMAVEDDAEKACEVLRRSIEQLCIADHRNDAPALQAWLANKTPENVRAWMRAPGQCMMIAEENGAILGVGAARAAGEITLNYVAPEARFRGVSKAMLAALEGWLRGQGVARARLFSTRTAHRFYRSASYEDEPEGEGRLGGQPMAKAL